MRMLDALRPRLLAAMPIPVLRISQLRHDCPAGGDMPLSWPSTLHILDVSRPVLHVVFPMLRCLGAWPLQYCLAARSSLPDCLMPWHNRDGACHRFVRAMPVPDSPNRRLGRIL